MSLKAESISFLNSHGLAEPNPELFYFDEKAADLPIKFIENFCCHSKGKLAGQAFKLLPWQRGIVLSLYGWMNKDGSRKYRKLYLQVARKAGKTLLASGLALYGMLIDRTDGTPEVVLAASARDQAKICFDNLKEFHRASPHLRKRIQVLRNEIRDKQSSATLKVLSSDAGVSHGLNISTAIIDELHVWKNHELLEAITTSQGARSQPLNIIITTAGNNTNSICHDLYDYSKSVKKGTHTDESFLPVIYELDEEDDWKDQKNWIKANPSLGDSNSLTFLESEFNQALQLPVYERSFRQLYLNEWVSGTNGWLNIQDWNKNKIDFKQLNVESLPCWIGVDLSSADDMTSIVQVFKDETKNEYYVKPHFFMPNSAIEKRSERTTIPFRQWRDSGLIKSTEGERLDSEEIFNYIKKIIDKHDVRLLMYDPFGAQFLIPRIESVYPSLNCLLCYQGIAQLGPKTIETEKAIINGLLKHDGNEVLKWQIGNAVPEYDSQGRYKISRKKSNEKIDGIVGLIMAYGACVEGLGGDTISKYSKGGGILFL